MKKIAERKDTSPEEGEHKYGDVTYADPKNKKYPINTEGHVRAALSYWGQAKNRAKYSPEDQKTIGERIHAAARRMGIGAEKRWVGTIAKVDEGRGLVYGWASIAQNSDGSLVEDSQGDIIEPGDLEDAAHDFMLHHRAVDEMHVGDPVGAIVESLVVTAEKMERMGIPPEIADTLPTGWWVGAKVPPDVFAKVRSGEYAGFSIGGTGRREPV